MKKFYFILLIFFFSTSSYCQLTIDTTKSAFELTQILAGSGIQIMNASYYGSMSDVGISAFSNGQTTNLGLSSGVVISTGRAMDIPQPAISFSGFNNGLLVGDSLLSSLAGGFASYNTGYLEFDFIPAYDSIELTFLFSSEEYTEYVCSQFSDAVGIFLSGEYPLGTFFSNKNIALVPNTTLPVNINTINQGSVGQYGSSSGCVSLNYSSLFIDNAQGTSIVFDGFTVPLKAKANVIHGKTYHMRIAIADIGDGSYDSGVFLEAHSLKSITQNSSASLCVNSQPLCFSSQQTFSLLVNTQAETGPNYGCLYSYPNPSWFNIHVSQPGNLVFNISPTNNNDLDFICWGPFDDAYAPCTALLTSNNIVDCSYSANSQEVIDINNAAFNAYYIFMVTNFSNTPTNVVITQTNAGQPGAGSITCTPISNCNIDSVVVQVGNCDSLNRYQISGWVHTTNTPTNGFMKITDVASNTSHYVPSNGSGSISFSFWVPFSTGPATLEFEFSEGTCTKTVNYQRPKVPTVTANIGNSSCGQSNGYIIIGVTANGIPNYSYHWSTGQTVNNTSSTASYLQNISTGSYSVSVYNSNNCYSKYTYNIENVGAPVITLSEDSSNICQESCNANLTASATSMNNPLTYYWSTGYQYTDTFGNGSVLTSLCNGTYYVTVSDINNCSSVASHTINPISNLQVETINIHFPSCANSNNGFIHINASNGTPPYSYLWSTNPPQTTNVAGNLTSGVYSCTVSDAQNCTITNIYELPYMSNINVAAQLQEPRCGNDGVVQLIVNGGVPPYNYIWNTDPNNHSNVLSGLNSGIYFVTIVDALGCEVFAQYSLYHHATPLSVTVTSIVNICNGQNNGMAVITATGGTPPYFDGQHTFYSTDTIVHLASGSYTVMISDSLGCTAPVTFQIQSLPIPILTAFISNSSCGQANGSIVLSLGNGTPPYSYSWSNGITINGTNNSVVMNQNLNAGVYSVTVVNGNGCTVDSFFVVNNQTSMMASIDSIAPPSCQNTPDGCASILVENGMSPYIYNWSNGCTNNTCCNMSPGDYFVTITDASNCNYILPINMPQGQLPFADFNYTSMLNTYQFNNLSTPGNYVWMFGDGNVSTEINPVYTYSTDGTYTVCLTLFSCDTITHCTIIHVVGSNVSSIDLFKPFIVPNPANEYFELKLPDSKIVLMELYNSLMQKIDEKRIKDNSVIRTSDLAEGIYFVKLTNGTDSKIMKLIIRHQR